MDNLPEGVIGFRLDPSGPDPIPAIYDTIADAVGEPRMRLVPNTQGAKCRECEYAAEEELLFADGFDDAIIGCSTGVRSGFLAYSHEKCVEILMEEGLTEEDAEEHMSYNVAGGWVGDHTPVFIRGCCE